MSQGTSGSEQNRIVTAIVLLVLGLLLLLWAWGSWVYRASLPESVTTASGAGNERLNTERLYAMGSMIPFTLPTLLVSRGARDLKHQATGGCDAIADYGSPEALLPRRRSVLRPSASAARRRRPRESAARVTIAPPKSCMRFGRSQTAPFADVDS